ncbi:MAG: hypothetical protein Q7K42_01610 [Candidatus Diapherotrites archaeon]|nr:hypothetical protein [Candidatus Diapherotrites archaeon]
MSRISVAVCLPLYGQVPSVFFRRFLEFLSFSGQKYNVEVLSVDFTAVDVARNIVVERFLKESKSDYALFLDSDMVFPANLLDLLFASNKEIVSGLFYSRKKIKPAFRMLTDGKHIIPEKFSENELVKVDAVGLSCMLLKRSVLEKLDSLHSRKPLFINEYSSRKDFLGEDFYFCKLLREAGFEIFLDPKILIGHMGGIIPEEKFKDYVY